MGLLNHLIFDDISSQTYGFYIDGQATFDAPARRGETVTVPGRNGTLFLDEDTFDNITVEYEAFLDAPTEEEFQQRIRDFRSALLSKRGYLRLTDTYHPEEFRLAMYKSGLEIDPIMYNRAGKFKLQFDCKPQRYLKTGEEPLTDPGNGIWWYIHNPTPFATRPLIEIYGYGQLWLNGYCLTVRNLPVGRLPLIGTEREAVADSSLVSSFWYGSTDFNSGDTGTLNCRMWIKFKTIDPDATIISVEELSTADCATTRSSDSDGVVTVGLICTGLKLSMPTSGSSSTKQVSATVRVNFESSGVETHLDVTVQYEIEAGSSGLTIVLDSITNPTVYVRETRQVDSFTVNSTVSALGNPLYVDMESGDAYKIEDGETVYVNNAIWLGEDLPALEPGDTMVVPDSDTGMTVRIIPRWWVL